MLILITMPVLIGGPTEDARPRIEPQMPPARPLVHRSTIHETTQPQT